MKLSFDVETQPRVYPYDYGESLARSVYSRFGLEDHDGLSTHSVGWFWGSSDATSRGLVFEGIQTWSVGLLEEKAKRLVQSLRKEPEIIPGAEVVGGRRLHPSPEGTYRTSSPILVRLGDEHLPYNHDRAGECLTHSARRKLKKVGVPENLTREVSISFSGEGKTKVVSVCGNQYLTNQCSVNIDAPNPLQEGLMTTGLGGLTGMGLGSIVPDNA